MGRGEDPLRHLPRSRGAVFPGTWVLKAPLQLTADCLSPGSYPRDFHGSTALSRTWLLTKRGSGWVGSLIVRGLRTNLSPARVANLALRSSFYDQLRKGSFMKGFLAVIVLLVVCVAAFGFYQGWFKMSTDNTDHKSNVTFWVDQDKFKADEEKAKEKIQD